MKNSKFNHSTPLRLPRPFNLVQGRFEFVEKRAEPRGKIQNSKFRPSSGYIALISLLIFAAAALTIGITVSLRGIEEIQMSYNNGESLKAKFVANACLEDGLERLRNNWADYSGSLSIDGNSCIINITVNGNDAALAATGTVGLDSQAINFQVQRNLIDNSLEVTSWQEG